MPSTRRILAALAIVGAVVAGAGQLAVSTVCACAPPKPEAAAWPTVTGTTQVGEQLATTDGTWVSAGNHTGESRSYAYVWRRCDSGGANCVDIPGASASTYTLVSGDSGKTIRSAVTATSSGGAATQASAQTAAVTGGVTPVACDYQAGSTAAIQTALNSAADGKVVCVTPGTYSGDFTLTRPGTPAGYVTIEPGSAGFVSTVPNGAGKVTFTGTPSLTGPYIEWHNFYDAGINLPSPYNGTSAKHINIDHNDLSPGIDGGGPDCTVPHPPGSCSGGYQPLQYITVNGNKIHDAGRVTQSEDALHFNHAQHLTISANDIYGNVQAYYPDPQCDPNPPHDCPHTDSFQVVWGSSDILLDHNYFHDSHDEVFILKDGDLINVTLTDNLVVRQSITDDSVANESAWIVSTHNSILRNNTIWPTQSVFVSADSTPPASCSGDPYCSTSAYSTTLDHNVLEDLGNKAPGGTYYTTVTSDTYNIFSHSPSQSAGGWSLSGTDSINASPTFQCGVSCGNGTPAGDNYQLSTNPNGIGIDWSPIDYVYGPS